jgi:endonuclease/exonuclease/phosphatase (EEP) superfamily protein YafD
VHRDGAEHVRRRRPRASRTAFALTFIVFILTALSYATSLHWRFELLTHARPHLAAASLVALVLCLAGRRRIMAVLAAALLAANGAPLVPYLLPATEDGADGGQAVRLLWFNLHSDAVATEDALSLIAAERPDIIMLTEVPRRGSLLRTLQKDYPYAMAGKEGSPFYVVTLSRFPLGATQVDRSVAEYLPIFRVEVCPDGEGAPSCWVLVGIHAPRPLTEPGARKRDEALMKAAGYAAAVTDGRVAVVGDFNLTPWSPAFARMLQSGDLTDAQRGHSLSATWLLRFPLIGLPIDHVLVGQGVAVRDLRVGPFLGSDHRPVIADLTVH